MGLWRLLPSDKWVRLRSPDPIETAWQKAKDAFAAMEEAYRAADAKAEGAGKYYDEICFKTADAAIYTDAAVMAASAASESILGGLMIGKMSLERAERTAEAIIARLNLYCSRIEVVGSIRRRRPWVNDIDLVLIPKDLWGFHNEVLKLGEVKMSGAKLMRLMVGDIQVDINIADESTWATLLLVKTGSAQHNIFLASLAKKKGWHLAASGDGLFNEKNERVAGDSELSIFRVLGLSYKEPKDREVGGRL